VTSSPHQERAIRCPGAVLSYIDGALDMVTVLALVFGIVTWQMKERGEWNIQD